MFCQSVSLQRGIGSPHRQVATGEVDIQGGIYDLETGEVEFLGQSPALALLSPTNRGCPLPHMPFLIN